MASATTVGMTGSGDIDGLLSGYKWTGVVTYSFTDAASDYSAGTPEATAAGFAQISAAQQTAVHTAFGQVQQFTNLTMQYAGTNDADTRIAQSSKVNPTAYAYYPWTNTGGDVWFGTQYNYRDPKMGDYQYFTHLHELGHSLGLKHAHEGTALPVAHDSVEYTVMTYRSYVGGPTNGGYSNETYGYPTTYMMNDIRAMQQMYGADFNSRSGDTVYSWSTTTGETFIDGVGQGQPGGVNAPAAANVIFMTVWDGNGNDTYSFANYNTGVTVNLNPGAYSLTSADQLAYLGGGQSAHGSVYNAVLYNNDARSYIENVVGGSGGDTLIGNAIGNRIDGCAGNDTMTGGAGADVFVFHSGYGCDIITDFSVGFDDLDLTTLAGFDTLAEVLAVGVQSGANAVLSFGFNLSVTLQNVTLGSLSATNFLFDAITRVVAPNQAPTALALGNLSVDEHNTGALVGAISVNDADDTVFTFTVSDERFQVVGTPGAYALKLVDGVALDYDAQRALDLTVTATDSRGGSITSSFHLAINDLTGPTIAGTNGNDFIDGTRTVVGQQKTTAGDDTINAAGGNDIVYGLAGNDVIDGGTGNDTLYGDAGNDRITGGAGSDLLDGGSGNDVFTIAGDQAQTDTFIGGDGTDTIQVIGGDSVTLNRFNASTASIEAWVGNGAAILGTAAADTIDLSGLRSVSGIGYVDGGAGNDTLIGFSGENDLRGGAGNDTIMALDGNDRLEGGAGADTLDGGAGDDRFVIAGNEALGDIIRGGAGSDAIVVSSAAPVILSRFDAAAASIEAWNGNGGAVLGTTVADTIDLSGLQTVSGMAYVDGDAGNDKLVGHVGGDDLRGGIGNDTIYGLDGNDRLTGGAGVDTVEGGSGDDVFVISGSDAASDVMRGGDGIDAVQVTGSDAVTLSRFDAGASSIEVWDGNDAAVLGTGGADLLDFSGLLSSSGIAYIDGGAGNDKLLGTGEADDLRGGVGNDVLSGNDGNDKLTGGAGVDTVDGGNGDDTILFGGTEGQGDTMIGGAGFDAVEITGAGSVTLGRFEATASSIEAWHGNGAGVIGTKGADIFDFGGLLDVTRLSFVDGGDGNDTLIGSRAADDLRGGLGSDTLSGGAGDDILTGGKGNDRFIFDAGFGHDTITDFEGGSKVGDVIQMSRTVFVNLEQLLAASQQVGDDVVVTADTGNTLTLEHAQLGALHANDFNFV
jgi:serralysin